EGDADSTAGARRVDGRLVPGPPSGASTRLAGRRPRPGQGGLGVLLRPAQADDRGGSGRRRAVRPVPEPLRALPPDRPADGPAHMTIREATPQDRERLRELYQDFVRELPPPPGIPVDIEHELGELDDYLGDQNVALVAEGDGGRILGFALAKIDHPGIGHLSDIYVAPEARRQGAARELIREAATRLRDAEGASVLTLGVQVTNQDAQAAYERLGFQTESLRLFASIEQLLERSQRGPRGPSFGSVHVQIDDENAVEQAVRKYVPRFGRSGGSIVSGPRNGWIAVYDELSDREPGVLRRLGSELSNATGAVCVAIGVEEGAIVRYNVFDRGSVVDEYLSVPEY